MTLDLKYTEASFISGFILLIIMSSSDLEIWRFFFVDDDDTDNNNGTEITSPLGHVHGVNI